MEMCSSVICRYAEFISRDARLFYIHSRWVDEDAFELHLASCLLEILWDQ